MAAEDKWTSPASQLESPPPLTYFQPTAELAIGRRNYMDFASIATGITVAVVVVAVVMGVKL